MSKIIKTRKGIEIIVDDEDYERLNKFTWRIKRDGYPSRNPPKENGKQRVIPMHIEILGKRDGYEIDHINRNKLDNRKENLRFVTHAQNCRNSYNTRGKSKYKGVAWISRLNKWRARININKKQYYIGFFENEIDAAIAYNQKAVELDSEFAYLNEL